MRKPALAAVLSIACTACGDRIATNLPGGQQAYDIMAVSPDLAAQQQLLREGDKLSIRVFGEPELTSEETIIDDAGNIQVPLLGEIMAAGRTSSQLRNDITSGLGRSYIRNPQVTVNVLDRTTSTVSIEGQVTLPGVFATSRSMTLLSALALAHSPTRTAKLNEIIIFRVADGHRVGAQFDLRLIRAGKAPDPQILPGDTVVVGFDSLKGAYRDFLQTAPLIGLFRTF
jgi:polysaccharide export outer membrane protein